MNATNNEELTMPETTKEFQKAVIQWIEVSPDGSAIVQTRRYNNAEKAESFCQSLYKRGVKTYTKNTIEKITVIKK